MWRVCALRVCPSELLRSAASCRNLDRRQAWFLQPTAMRLISSMISARLAASAAIAAAILVSGPSAPALTEPDRVDLRIEVFGFAGFHILTNRTSVAASGDQYAIAMDLD